ncbi:MAG: sulfite oxidase-like oxidoreductase [Patescibacteria group bacterium]|nr:sulfite oxidase-like oxidoreductase [Patescibacteria group bacterium]MDE2116608.1 sulfite oxidase-like oxidoreductase [Patescibacteria group bacterium]
MIINEGFKAKRAPNDRLPPGQYEETGFPVLSLGPTPLVPLDSWRFEVDGLVDAKISWDWQQFSSLPAEDIVRDIHCVTKWSKFDTTWRGVSMDQIISLAGVSPEATHIIAHSHDGYTTNIPIEDIRGGKAWIAYVFGGAPLEPEHGGPARLLVPHLYFWKSAKWLSRLEFVRGDRPGFWETRGYHNYGDPWKEQRYTYD